MRATKSAVFARGKRQVAVRQQMHNKVQENIVTLRAEMRRSTTPVMQRCLGMSGHRVSGAVFESIRSVIGVRGGLHSMTWGESWRKSSSSMPTIGIARVIVRHSSCLALRSRPRFRHCCTVRVRKSTRKRDPDLHIGEDCVSKGALCVSLEATKKGVRTGLAGSR